MSRHRDREVDDRGVYRDDGVLQGKTGVHME